MRYIIKRLAQLLSDENGGEIMEYVIVAGLITIAALSVIGAFGGKVVAKWTSINSSM